MSFPDFWAATAACSPAVDATGATALARALGGAVVSALGPLASATATAPASLPESRASASERRRSISSKGKAKVAAMVPSLRLEVLVYSPRGMPANLERGADAELQQAPQKKRNFRWGIQPGTLAQHGGSAGWACASRQRRNDDAMANDRPRPGVGDLVATELPLAVRVIGQAAGQVK